MGRKRKPTYAFPKDDAGIQLPCKVCCAPATGFHYGVNTCEACKGFFYRSIRVHPQYRCDKNNQCTILYTEGRLCQLCRYMRCLEVGMAKEFIKTGRYSLLKRIENNAEKWQLKIQASATASGVPYPSGQGTYLGDRDDLYPNTESTTDNGTARLEPKRMKLAGHEYYTNDHVSWAQGLSVGTRSPDCNAVDDCFSDECDLCSPDSYRTKTCESSPCSSSLHPRWSKYNSNHEMIRYSSSATSPDKRSISPGRLFTQQRDRQGLANNHLYDNSTEAPDHPAGLSFDNDTHLESVYAADESYLRKYYSKKVKQNKTYLDQHAVHNRNTLQTPPTLTHIKSKACDKIIHNRGTWQHPMPSKSTVQTLFSANGEGSKAHTHHQNIHGGPPPLVMANFDDNHDHLFRGFVHSPRSEPRLSPTNRERCRSESTDSGNESIVDTSDLQAVHEAYQQKNAVIGTLVSARMETRKTFVSKTTAAQLMKILTMQFGESQSENGGEDSNLTSSNEGDETAQYDEYQSVHAVAASIKRRIRDIVKFANSIPGFLLLSSAEKTNIIQQSRREIMMLSSCDQCCTHNTRSTDETKLATSNPSSSSQCECLGIMSVYLEFFPASDVSEAIELCKATSREFKALELTDEEKAIVEAIIVMTPDRESGQEIPVTRLAYDQLNECLRHLLQQRRGNSLLLHARINSLLSQARTFSQYVAKLTNSSYAYNESMNTLDQPSEALRRTFI